MRIVSLIASGTEIVHALGFGSFLVGRSHECDFPPSVHGLPVLTAPSFGVDGSSREIDDRVRALVREAPSVYLVDAEALLALQPDVVITQSHCDVCAVSLTDVEHALCDWLDARPTVVSLEPDSLSGVWSDIRRVAAALGAPGKGAELVRVLRARMDEIRRRADSATGRPRLGFLEWVDPLMAGGNWVPELVAMAGGENVFGTTGRRSPRLGWDELAEWDPDALFVAPCGFDLDRTWGETCALTREPGWPKLSATRSGRVYVADGNHYFNRPGPRLVQSLEILAEALHPELFRFGHEGKAWKRFQPEEEC
ncbi:MAG: cobalamin-binding protein [Deltaproteobacteria bacterium]|nr:cobalamin-binding protein [Deltaproteobacteria bacterium]